jgi:hypothetical protein
MPPTTADAWIVPELGPSLGRLSDPPASLSERGGLNIGFEDIRLDLVTGIFDVAGAARSFAASGDRQGAIASLGRVAWLDIWERAVAAAAQRLADAVNAHLRDAAAESHFPPRRLPEILLSAEDVRAIGSRLGSGGASSSVPLMPSNRRCPPRLLPVPAAALVKKSGSSPWLLWRVGSSLPGSRWPTRPGQNRSAGGPRSSGFAPGGGAAGPFG